VAIDGGHGCDRLAGESHRVIERVTALLRDPLQVTPAASRSSSLQQIAQTVVQHRQHQGRTPQQPASGEVAVRDACEDIEAFCRAGDGFGLFPSIMIVLVCVAGLGLNVCAIARKVAGKPVDEWMKTDLALAGIGTCFYLMDGLPWKTWVRFGVWLLAGLVIYFLYGFRKSRLATPATSRLE